LLETCLPRLMLPAHGKRISSSIVEKFCHKTPQRRQVASGSHLMTGPGKF
jgi:hypothetical protein